MKLGELLRERDRCKEMAQVCRETARCACGAMNFELVRSATADAVDFEKRLREIEDELDGIDVVRS